MSVNRVILVGNLGADPELRHVGDNRAVCDLRIATNESFKAKDGTRQDRTEWHRVTVWGENAESCAKYLEKGRMVYVEGKLQTRSYEKDGQKKFTTDIVADTVTFLSNGSGQRSAAPAGNEGPPRARGGWGADKPASGGNGNDGGDDIPL